MGKNCARGLEYGPMILQPLTNGFVYATLSLNRVVRRLLTICKKIFATNELSNSDTRQEKMY